jgi:hypothetical protein
MGVALLHKLFMPTSTTERGASTYISLKFTTDTNTRIHTGQNMNPKPIDRIPYASELSTCLKLAKSYCILQHSLLVVISHKLWRRPKINHLLDFPTMFAQTRRGVFFQRLS